MYRRLFVQAGRVYARVCGLRSPVCYSSRLSASAAMCSSVYVLPLAEIASVSFCLVCLSLSVCNATLGEALVSFAESLSLTSHPCFVCVLLVSLSAVLTFMPGMLVTAGINFVLTLIFGSLEVRPASLALFGV